MTGEDTKIALRATTHHDIAFAWSLYRALMKPAAEELFEWDEHIQRRFIENDLVSGEASIITIAGRDTGWIRVRETGREICVLQLYLVPKFVNRRVGRVMIGQLIDRARSTERQLFLELTNISRTRQMYERLGFITTGQTKHKLQMAWRDDGSL